MKLFTLCLPAFSLALCLLAISAEEQDPIVEATILNESNWDATVPAGKEVDAIYGDAVLRNRFLTAVIAQPVATRQANMTVREIAGCLIDLTSREMQSDQLACFYPGQKGVPFRSWVLGRDGKTEVATAQTSVQGKSASVTVTSQGGEGRPTIEVRYSLTSDSPYLSVVTRYTNGGENPLKVSLADDLRLDGRKEEMTRSSNGKTDVYWAEDGFWQQAYGLRVVGRSLMANTSGNTGVLRYVDVNDQDEVRLEPGESVEVVREIACGPTRAHVQNAFRDPKDLPTSQVTLRLLDGLQRSINHARFQLVQDGKPITSGRATREGVVKLPLLEGDYQAQLLRDRKSFATAALHVGKPERQEHRVVFPDYKPGTVTMKIVDDAGKPIPCKVAFNGLDETPSPHFGPDTASFGVRNVRYSPNGSFVEDLVPGRYQVVVSRGPEFDAIIREITVAVGENTPFDGVLKRSVDTTGWISSDFHSHSSPSGDNTSSQLGRVLNLVCEHIEFAPCTEHNRITTYQPHFDQLGIGEFISSTTGIELTHSPLPLSHHNAFPLHHHPHQQDGGAPQTDDDVEVQIQRLAAWDNGSEKLVQQNHPDIGWLFYDRNGDGHSDEGYPTSISLMDVMEIHPIENVLKLRSLEGVTEQDAKRNRIFKWLQLTNQGYRIPGVVNTDAHYNFHGSGGRRNWIRCSTDAPSQIDPMEIVRAAEEGRVVMSNGPFLEVWAHGADNPTKATAGEDLPSHSHDVQLDIRVQCPNWCDIDTVLVFINGVLTKDRMLTRDSHPKMFSKETVRFEHSLPLHLETDAHIVVACCGVNSKLGPVMGPSTGQEPPAALANPIFVDVDGNGFKPNKNSLGRPLPVKGD